MYYEFRNKHNPDDRVCTNALTAAEARQKLRGMVLLRGLNISDYEEVKNARVSECENHPEQE